MTHNMTPSVNIDTNEIKNNIQEKPIVTNKWMTMMMTRMMTRNIARYNNVRDGKLYFDVEDVHPGKNKENTIENFRK